MSPSLSFRYLYHTWTHKRLRDYEKTFRNLAGLSLYHNCDLTTIRLRYDDTTTHSTTTKWSKLLFVFDSTAIRIRHDYDEKLTCSFFCSRRIASNGSRRARYVVVGSYSRIVVETQSRQYGSRFAAEQRVYVKRKKWSGMVENGGCQVGKEKLSSVASGSTLRYHPRLTIYNPCH